jgi:hypothetical protein
MKTRISPIGAILGVAVALCILALAHSQHLWTLLGSRYN